MSKIPIFYNMHAVNEKPTAKDVKAVNGFKRFFKQSGIADRLIAFERSAGFPFRKINLAEVGIEKGREAYYGGKSASGEGLIVLPEQALSRSDYEEEWGVAHEYDQILRQNVWIMQKLSSLIIFGGGFYTSDIARIAVNVKKIKEEFRTVRAFNKKLKILYPIHARAKSVAAELGEYITGLGAQSAEDLKAIYEASPERWFRLLEILSPLTEKDAQKVEDFSQRIWQASLISGEALRYHPGKYSLDETGVEQIRWDLMPSEFERNLIREFSGIWLRSEEHLIDKAVIHVARDPEAMIADLVRHTAEIDAMYPSMTEEERKAAAERNDPDHPYSGTRVKFMRAELQQRRAREQGR